MPKGKPIRVEILPLEDEEIQLPRYYYHGTSSKFLPNMRLHGLRPVGSQWRYVFTDSLISIAESHALIASRRAGGRPLILTIDRSKVPDTLIVKLTQEDLFATEIPPEAIVKIESLKKEHDGF